VLRLKPRRKYCQLSRLSHEVGWKYQTVVATLEKRRKLKSSAFYKSKVTKAKLMEAAKKNVAKKVEPYQKVIESFGYH